MKFPAKTLLALIVSFAGLCMLNAQQNTFYEPVNIKKAYEQKTRSREGTPGSAYWQNEANYRMDIRFDPQRNLLIGDAVINYFNNSPDTLKELVFHLFPNVYRSGAIRDFEIDPRDAGKGMKIKSLTVGGKAVDLTGDSQMWYVDRTMADLNLDAPMDFILPDTMVTIEVSWEYTVNALSHMRTGQVDSSSFFIAYFFPRVGVYDDVEGWNYSIYQGTTEFYNDYGNFDVSITLPAGFVTWATGSLQNPKQCFTKKYLDRYQQALDTSTLVKIIEKQDLQYRDFTPADPEVVWNFKADHVTDFAFALSDHYLWDAIRVETDPDNERYTLVNSAYDQHSADFFKVIHLAKKSVEYMSGQFPAIPFPYPQVTVFNGLDMMEYPMMVNDISMEQIEETFSLTAHEIFHNYFPFATGNNERKYAWMDEGITSFFEFVMMREIVNENFTDIYQMDSYINEVGHERDLPLITPSELIRPPHYYHNSYSKAVMFYLTLDHEMGRDSFTRFIQSFFENWKGKHPTGFDFLYAISRFTEGRYDALIRAWFFEFGYVDYAIEKVSSDEKHATITLAKKGKYPATVYVQAVYDDEETELVGINPSQWDTGSNTYSVKIDAKGLREVNLIYDLPLDACPGNNHYSLQTEE